MSIRLACELSDRIAAIAPVAAGSVPPSCNPLRPVPIIAFKGTLDQPSYPFVAANIELVSIHNGCTDKTEIYYQKGNTICTAYKGCYKNSDVVFCDIEGGGHSWPGAILDLCLAQGYPPDCYYAASHDIDASWAIWKFFEKHSMPGWN